MTPISEMTNEELDRYIAEKRGWTYWDEYQCWLNPTNRELGIIYELPSYTTDPRYAMELLKEMEGASICFGNYSWGKWGCFPDMQPVFSDTPERAISEAWLQWKEQG